MLLGHCLSSMNTRLLLVQKKNGVSSSSVWQWFGNWIGLLTKSVRRSDMREKFLFLFFYTSDILTNLTLHTSLCFSFLFAPVFLSSFNSKNEQTPCHYFLLMPFFRICPRWILKMAKSYCSV